MKRYRVLDIWRAVVLRIQSVRLRRAGPSALLVLALASPVASATLTVYDDALQNGWDDWSWATHSTTQTAVVHAGTRAISWEPDGWQGVQFQHPPLAAVSYASVRFWHNGAGGNQAVRLVVTLGATQRGEKALTPLPAGWTQVTVTLAEMGITGGSFDRIVFQAGTAGDQPTAYLDDLELVESGVLPPPPAAITVAVDPNLDRRPVSPLIYGVNFAPPARIAPIGYSVNRWGGNSTTRYSWEDDISNRASDWFFYNIEENNAHPENLPDGSAADVFIDQTLAGGAEPLITVPTIGWTPVDRTRRWGFSVAKYGAQQQTECTASGNPNWCQPDAGNGLHPNGTPIVGNDPRDTSREIGAGFVTDWMAHIAGRTGTAGAGGVRLFALDNEPTLWDSTHRDVHPDPATYDELWSKVAQYATAMKAQDANAEIFGPVTWGWCDIWTSAADTGPGDDDCTDGPDRQAHPLAPDYPNGAPLLVWYLHQICANPLSGGRHLVDWLDVHFYPQGDGVAATGGDHDAQSVEDDEDTIQRRLRSLKELWDPTWTSESWVAGTGVPGGRVARLRGWIDTYCPGTKLAITEYKWGKDNTPSGALAQAEALAIFGREGVDLATRWVAPEAGDWVEDAFRLFRSYDGAGARVEGDATRALSSDVDAVGSYAVRSPTGFLFVLLFNKDTVARDTTVTIAGGAVGTVPLWRFDATNRLAAVGSVASTPTGFALQLPARSATLARVDLGRIFETSFEPSEPRFSASGPP